MSGPRGSSAVSSLLPAAVAGLVAGVLTVLFEVSYAALIFAGDLAPFVSRGITLLLMGSFLSLLITSLFSSYPGIAGLPQDAPVALIAALAGAVALAARGRMPVDQVFHTVVSIIVVTTLLTSLVLLLAGRLRLAVVARLIPYPVIGGFLAGVGWLLTVGGVELMAGFRPGLGNLGLLLDPTRLLRWLPGFGLGVLLLIAGRRITHFLTTPVAILGALGLFYLLLAVAGVSVAEARLDGWLLGNLGDQRLWFPFSARHWQSTAWGNIVDAGPDIASILLVSLLAVLLNTSGIELLTGRDLDFDRELNVTSAANFAAGLFGSTPAYHSVSFTALMNQVGKPRRLSGVIAAAICGLTLLAGTRMVSYVPRPVLGGMVVFMGLGFLYEWLIGSRKRLALADYLLMLGILVVVASFGFLAGVALGTLAAVVLFAFTYGRGDVVHQELSGESIWSNVDRSSRVRRALREAAGSICVLKLRGFLFFGTANGLYQSVRRRINDAESRPVSYLILDLRRVRGIDGSAQFVLLRVCRAVTDAGGEVVFVSAKPEVYRRLRRILDSGPKFFPDLDHGLEWCEDRLLVSECPAREAEGSTSVEELLLTLGAGDSEIDTFLDYLQERVVAPGDYVIRQGEESQELFFLVEGEMEAILESGEDEAVRLRTMRPGAVFGEIALYLGVPRSLSVRAAEASRCYCLTRRALGRLREEFPDVALAFQDLLIRNLSERLVDLNRTIQSFFD